MLVAPGEDAIATILLAALTPAVLGPALLQLGRNLPWLVEGGTIPAAGGIFRRGNPDIYDIVVIEAQS